MRNLTRYWQNEMIMLLFREEYKTCLKLLYFQQAKWQMLATRKKTPENIINIINLSDCTDGILYYLPLLLDIGEGLVFV